jgi:prefoldin subunit 5
MVTKQEVDNILKEVNAILRRLDERITALEAEKKTTTTRNTRSQQK